MRARWLQAALAVCVFGLAPSARPATLNVTVATDGPNALDGNCTLREAVQAANGPAANVDCGTPDNPGLDIITFAGGVTTITIAAAQGVMNINSEVDIQGPIIIDGANGSR